MSSTFFFPPKLLRFPFSLPYTLSWQGPAKVFFCLFYFVVVFARRLYSMVSCFSDFVHIKNPSPQEVGGQAACRGPLGLYLQLQLLQAS